MLISTLQIKVRFSLNLERCAVWKLLKVLVDFSHCLLLRETDGPHCTRRCSGVHRCFTLGGWSSAFVVFLLCGEGEYGRPLKSILNSA